MRLGLALAVCWVALPFIAPREAASAPVPVHTRAVCPDGRGTRQAEPAIAVRDSVIVVCFNDLRGLCPQAGYQVGGWSYSLDRGATFVEGGPLPGGTRWSFDQWLEVGPDGAFYHAALSSPPSRHGVILSRGVVVAGGIAWSEPIEYVPPAGSCDKPGMAIDPVSGTIYIAYTLFAGLTNPASGLWLLRSTDGGQSFLPPVQVASIPPTSGAHAAFPVVLLDGSLALAWKTGRTTDPTVTLYFARSTDGGDTFSGPSVVATACTFNAPGTDGSPVFPQLALDRSSAASRGALYLAWQTACPREGASTAGDLAVTRSNDSGASWGAPVVANSDSGTALHVQPTLTVDGYGRPWLFAYRVIAMGDSSIATLVSMRSEDGGATFEPIQEVTDVPSVWGVIAEPGPQNYGEYITAITTGDYVHVAYCDARFRDPDVYWTVFPTGDVTAVAGGPAHARSFLDSIVPNPSTNEVRLRFGFARPADFRLAIYDISGRLVRLLDRGRRGMGTFSASWDLNDRRGRRVAPGVYVVRLHVAGEDLTRSIVVAR